MDILWKLVLLSIDYQEFQIPDFRFQITLKPASVSVVSVLSGQQGYLFKPDFTIEWSFRREQKLGSLGLNFNSVWVSHPFAPRQREPSGFTQADLL